MTSKSNRFVAGPLETPPIARASYELDLHEAPFAIYCPSELLSRIMEHAVQFKHTEVFGLLLGRPVLLDDNRIRTVIEDFVAAEVFEQSTLTYVEVSAREILRMHASCEDRFSKNGLRIAGWFHTHPGHGIFMSSTDRQNHRLYTQAWQVALVIDPQRRTTGFFQGLDCHPVPQEHVLAKALQQPADGDPLKKSPQDGATADVAVPEREVEETVDQENVEETPGKSDETPKGSRRWKPGISGNYILLAFGAGLITVISLLYVKLSNQQALLEEERGKLQEIQAALDRLAQRSGVVR